MNKDFFVENRKKLSDSLEDNSILVMFSGEAPQKSADQPYKYTINRNFYYMTGLEREKFILAISKKKGRVEEILFIEEVNPQLEKWLGRRLREEEAKEISGIEKVQYISTFKPFMTRSLLSYPYENIYLDLEKRGWEGENTASINFAKDISEKYPYLNIRNIYHKISSYRMIKSTEEVDKIKKAIEITKQGIESLMNNSKPDLMEYQLEAYFDFAIKSLGAKNHAFNTIAASGENATILHYEENNCKMKNGDMILFDLGSEFENYCSDITRTFPVNGKFTNRQKELYNIVLKAMNETIKAIKPGVPFKELNNITKSVLSKECISIGLIKEDSEISKYYYHGVSHYLGLDTHDVGDYDVVLEPGMVLTIEPGLYIEEEKIGIRIEDDILVTEDGYENLSKDIIKTVEEIEKYMDK